MEVCYDASERTLHTTYMLSMKPYKNMVNAGYFVKLGKNKLL